MRRNLLVGAVGAALAIGIAAAGLAETPAEIVKKRQELMKGQGAHMTAIYDFTQGKGTETAADVARRAEELQQSALQIAALFPPGTGRYAAPSAALPAIWTNWPEFEAAANKLAEEAGKLAMVAKDGDKAAIEAQFGATGKNGCGGCHSLFREKKN